MTLYAGDGRSNGLVSCGITVIFLPSDDGNCNGIKIFFFYVGDWGGSGTISCVVSTEVQTHLYDPWCCDHCDCHGGD